MIKKLVQVKQVLINLVGNALKFTFKGSIVVSAKIIKNEHSERLYILFLQMRVCDTGIGIRDQDKEKIFKMFGKLEATEKINTSGIGLGVSICKQIIEGLGGTLSFVEGCDSLQCLQKLVYSDPIELKEGTTFQFSVKVQDQYFDDLETATTPELDQQNLGLTPYLKDVAQRQRLYESHTDSSRDDDHSELDPIISTRPLGNLI